VLNAKLNPVAVILPFNAVAFNMNEELLGILTIVIPLAAKILLLPFILGVYLNSKSPFVDETNSCWIELESSLIPPLLVTAFIEKHLAIIMSTAPLVVIAEILEKSSP